MKTVYVISVFDTDHTGYQEFECQVFSDLDIANKALEKEIKIQLSEPNYYIIRDEVYNILSSNSPDRFHKAVTEFNSMQNRTFIDLSTKIVDEECLDL